MKLFLTTMAVLALAMSADAAGRWQQRCENGLCWMEFVQETQYVSMGGPPVAKTTSTSSTTSSTTLTASPPVAVMSYQMAEPRMERRRPFRNLLGRLAQRFRCR